MLCEWVCVSSVLFSWRVVSVYLRVLLLLGVVVRGGVVLRGQRSGVSATAEQG
jgi:hypothetical protein